MKKYHVSFELDTQVHGVYVTAPNEKEARKLACQRMQEITHCVIVDSDICAVEIE